MKKVSIQGIVASFHDEAARKYFGNDIEVIECSSFKESSQALANGDVDFSVMAIENSIIGSILPNYNLINDFQLSIIGEAYLRIELNLMALDGVKIEDIEIIQSHPIAIRQSEEFLSKFPKVKVLELNDTAECAKIIKEKKLMNTAAIAGNKAAERYGLNILVRNIETNRENYTRFLILSRELNPSKENEKASICFHLSSKVGSLSNVLNIFRENNLNMTKIQSVPIVGKPYEYSFHIDFFWENYHDYQTAMASIIYKVSNLSVLGEYKSTSYIE